MSWLDWIKKFFWEDTAWSAPLEVPTKNCGRVRDMSKVKWIVLHDTEGGTRAEDVARWMANTSGMSAVSAHFVTDNEGVRVRSVPDNRAAWTAGKANESSLQVEMVTPKGAAATWTWEQWLAQKQLLEATAEVVADWCGKYDIPPEFVDADGLRAGHKGITTHAEVTKAFYGGAGHFDPGKSFPMSVFLAHVEALI